MFVVLSSISPASVIFSYTHLSTLVLTALIFFSLVYPHLVLFALCAPLSYSSYESILCNFLGRLHLSYCPSNVFMSDLIPIVTPRVHLRIVNVLQLYPCNQDQSILHCCALCNHKLDADSTDDLCTTVSENICKTSKYVLPTYRSDTLLGQYPCQYLVLLTGTLL